MKQHDLLLLLCEVHPHVFIITISFKDKEVYVEANKTKWRKTLTYKRYMQYSPEYLAKEILDEYHQTRAGKEVLSNVRGA